MAAQLATQGIDQSKIADMVSNVKSSPCEIIALCVPTAENRFTSVSIYSDGDAEVKQAILNNRAMHLLKLCGNNVAKVYGDCFVGRSLDDERVDWERMDFSNEDLSDDAEWIRLAAKANAGKSMSSFSTSGTLQKFAESSQQQQQKQLLQEQQDIVSDDMPGVTWNQNKDEIEVRFSLPSTISAKELQVKIGSNTVLIGPKNGSTPLPFIFEKFLTPPKGGHLFGSVRVDDSTWSVLTEKDKSKVLAITLIKSNSAMWKSLLLA